MSIVFETPEDTNDPERVSKALAEVKDEMMQEIEKVQVRQVSEGSKKDNMDYEYFLASF